MTTDIPPTPAPPAKKRGCFFFAFWGGLAAAVVFCAGIAATLWWMQRSITPVELTESEKQDVQEKIEQIQEPESRYQAGGKSISFTERELNGLLNEHTGYGDRLKFEIDRDAINAYLVIDIPEDSAILAGKTIRMRGRLRAVFSNSDPQLLIEDITVYGISIPNAWLGEIKHRNLADDLFGKPGPEGQAVLRGIRDFKLNRGAIEIELAE